MYDEGDKLPTKVVTAATKHYKYCPVISADVELTLSAVKEIV